MRVLSVLLLIPASPSLWAPRAHWDRAADLAGQSCARRWPRLAASSESTKKSD